MILPSVKVDLPIDEFSLEINGMVYILSIV